MPIRSGRDKKGCFFRWGGGAKYYYPCGNKEAAARAKAKAQKQARAAYAGGYKEK